MNKISRQQFVDRLQNDWKDYAGRFHRLDPQAQKAFLASQGYADLAGLLGHVIAWWQDGAETVQKMLSDPNYLNPDYDVDLFNARAVERFAGTGDGEIERIYEAQRQAMLGLVNGLSDADLYNERVNTRLYYEIIMHWNEHMLA